MTGGKRTTAFAVAGRNRSLSGQDEEVELADHDFPLILTVPGDIDVLSWIRHAGNVRAEASSYAHLGYKEILETALAYHPQVKVKINWQHNSQEFGTADVDFPLAPNLSVSTKFRLSMRHNSTVPKMDIRVPLDHFAATIHQAIENYHSTISDLQIMPPTERQLLQKYGKAAVRSSSGLIHCLIEQRAKLTPDANAVQFELDKPLNFSMLNMLSNRLARQIGPYGVSVMPVHMHTFVHFIVALLAILKAGAAYVILDLDAGAPRRSYIIKDVQADFVLVDENTGGEFYKEFKVGDLLRQSISNDGSDIVTDQLASDVAYIIYTSGSSGNSKGVQLEHQAAFNGLQAFPKISKLRQLLFYNPVFSAAQRSILATLSRGGCLCLATKENLTVHLAMVINAMQINSIDYDLNNRSTDLARSSAVSSTTGAGWRNGQFDCDSEMGTFSGAFFFLWPQRVHTAQLALQIAQRNQSRKYRTTI